MGTWSFGRLRIDVGCILFCCPVKVCSWMSVARGGLGIIINAQFFGGFWILAPMAKDTGHK
eukprot:scaffold91130_cov25-Tisochrysis_lutea.AAC.1